MADGEAIKVRFARNADFDWMANGQRSVEASAFHRPGDEHSVIQLAPASMSRSPA